MMIQEIEVTGRTTFSRSYTKSIRTIRKYVINLIPKSDRKSEYRYDSLLFHEYFVDVNLFCMKMNDNTERVFAFVY